MPLTRLKYFLFFFCCCFSLYSTAQQYSIPWATQQPQWVFPIYFEEGTGQRDTIYIAYDPNASSQAEGSDTVFGEYKIPVDTNNFNASLCLYWSSDPNQAGDSTYKAIASQLSWVGQCGDAAFEIFFINGYLPLKMSWDVNLFRSDTLPFLDQDPSPRAEGWMFHNSYSQNPDMSYCAPTEGILMTDTAAFGMPVDGFCTRRDSAIITDIFCPNCPLPYMIIYIRGWTGMATGIIEKDPEKDPEKDFMTYPNPSNGRFTIHDPRFVIYDLEVYNSTGNKILDNYVAKDYYNVDISDMPDGIYLLRITTNKGIFSKKIIISN